MTDFAPLFVPYRGQKTRPIHLVDKSSFDAWLKKRPAEDRALLEAHRFDGKTPYAFAILPGGGEFEVVAAVKDAKELSPWCLAALAEKLPEGTYKLAECDPGRDPVKQAAAARRAQYADRHGDRECQEFGQRQQLQRNR